MRFRLGLCIGFGAGYYLGSMAGRERYEQINRTIGRIKRSDAYDTATERARELVDTGIAKARGAVGSVRTNGDDPTTPGPASVPFLPPSEPMP